MFFLKQNSDSFLVGFAGYVEVKYMTIRTERYRGSKYNILLQSFYMFKSYFRVGCGNLKIKV